MNSSASSAAGRIDIHIDPDLWVTAITPTSRRWRTGTGAATRAAENYNGWRPLSRFKRATMSAAAPFIEAVSRSSAAHQDLNRPAQSLGATGTVPVHRMPAISVAWAGWWPDDPAVEP